MAKWSFPEGDFSVGDFMRTNCVRTPSYARQILNRAGYKAHRLEYAVAFHGKKQKQFKTVYRKMTDKP